MVTGFEYFMSHIIDGLKNEKLSYGDIKFYFTRNRFVLNIINLMEKQDDTVALITGPPRSICYKDNTPTPALIGFCKKNSVSPDSIGFIEKKGKEYISIQKKILGNYSIDILKEILKNDILSIPFKRKMHLDELQNFIRPIRKMIFFKDDQVIPMKIFNITASNETFIHHFKEKIVVKGIEDYFNSLKLKGIILNEAARMKIITEKLEELKRSGITSNINEFQIKFLSYFSESPKIIMGKYDKRFLSLPVEILDLTLWKHQKCILLFKDGKPIDKYMTVCDDYTEASKVSSDYDKVILSRLDDAEFFYKNDLNTPIDKMYEKLKDTIYFENWGTYEKYTKYSEFLGEILCKQLDFNCKKLKDIIHYAKCDLASEVINEKTYTDLQGIMGYYYLINAGFSEEDAVALKEQYLPKTENGNLPFTKVGAILSLIDKIMLLSVVSSLKLKVSGSKDIYGVRRAALGIYKLYKEFDFNFNIIDILEKIGFLSQNEIDKIYDFLIERIKAFEKKNLNGEILEAALYFKEGNLGILNRKIYALWKFSKTPDFNDIKMTLKRVLNILEGENFAFDAQKVVEDDEKKLYKGFLEFKENMNRAKNNFSKIFELLKELKPLIDKFFDNVLVNVEDKKLRDNRKGLLTMIGDEILKVANFKFIS